ncbi:MAG: MMPL family transporter [Prevotellaceae bacterium]|jgi:predicted RND superfamily exporter protein|nr:MMPL family transporter [Prevotellaceae bacterium]
MVRLTVFIYQYFNRHKYLLYVILLVSTGLFAYFGSKIDFKEDISQLLPAVRDNGTLKFAFSDLKVKDRVFILFNPVTENITPEDLIEICDEFVAELSENDKDSLIADIFYQIDDETLLNGMEFLYGNAPVFLDAKQYGKIDSLLDGDAVERQMSENYSLLASVAGTAFKSMVMNDPVCFRSIFMSGDRKEGIFSLGGNYKMYDGHIFTPDTALVLAFLVPNFKSLDSKQSAKLVNLLRNESEKFMNGNPDVEILYHGAPVQNISNSERIKQDLLLTVSVSLCLIFIFLIICFKSISTLFHLSVPVIYGAIFALAVIYFINGSISIMALGIGALILGVAFSYCLHVICHYKYVASSEKMLKEQTVPIILGVLTTIGAFMGLLLTGSELLHDFGLFASLGLVGSTAFALVFLPHFFTQSSGKKSEKAFRIIEKINSYPFEKQKWLIIFILITGIVCFIASGNVKFDSNLRHIGYYNRQLTRSQDLLASKTADGQATFYFATVSDDLDSALIKSHNLSRKLDLSVKNGEIKGYSAPSSLFIPTGEQKKRIEHWNAYWTDARKADARAKVIAAGKKYGFSENMFEPFFNMLDAEYESVSLFDAGILPEEMQSNIIEYSDNRYLVFTSVLMDKESLWQVGDKFSKDDNVIILDPMYYASDMVKSVHSDFNTTLVISSLFVFLVLLISFKNPLIAIIAFIPMGLSWYIVLGLMSLFGLEFNLINIIISSFIFGVGVDYSIFIMDGLIARRRAEQSLLMHHKSAIFFSAITMIIVTVSLLFAVHPAIRSIGVATLIGMCATILISYSLQPFLFSILMKKQSKEKQNGHKDR